MPLRAKISIIAALCAVILLGLFFLGKGVRNVWRAMASTKWPRVQGTVVESSTSTSVSTDRKTGVKSTIFRAGLVFGYQVGGKSYATDTIHFGPTLGSGDSSDAALRHLRYPVGAPV